MIKTLIDVDPLTLTQTWHHYDPHTDETIIEEVQDVQPFLERNKLLYNNPELHKKDQDGKWVASIPNGVQLKWMRDYGINVLNKHHWPRVRRLLNSPEWKYLKVTPGKI